jgi:hypothetical protein
MKKKTLIIFEFADEIDIFLSKRCLNELKDADALILAIQPCAQAYLKMRGISYINTINFIDNESHQNILVKSSEIVDTLRKIFYLTDEIGLKESYNKAFTFYLRHYSILYMLWLIEIIEKAVQEIKPEVLVVVYHKYCPDGMDQIPSNERVVGPVVSKIAEKLNIKCDSLAMRDNIYNFGFKKSKKFFFEMIKFLVFHVSMFVLKHKAKNKKVILYSSNSYNLRKVVESFLNVFNNAVSVVLFDRPRLICLKKILIDRKRWNIFSSLPCIKIKDNTDFMASLNRALNAAREVFLKDKHLFIYRRIDFKEFVLLKIEKKMKPFLLKLYIQSYHLNNFIKKINPSLIISQTSTSIFNNLAELAFINNVPAVMISHGSHVPSVNKCEDIEWREHGLGLMNTPYKYLAVQTPLALKFLKKNPSNSTSVITGPLLFKKLEISNKEEIKKKIIPKYDDKIIFLHAGTPKPFQSSRPYIYETIDEYISNINSLIRVIEKIKKIHLIVRFRPSSYFKLTDFLSLLMESDCYSIHTEGAIEDYLSIADILISYSSTTIEEALQNKVPVLMYDPMNRYCHISDAKILEPSLRIETDSCYYINSEKNLLWGINWLLDNHFSKKNLGLMWGRYIFSENETIKLSSYFQNIFDGK